jgi:transposase-like protein
MQRRKFSREFKIEAVRLVGERGVSVAQASRGNRQLEPAIRARKTRLGLSSAQIATLVLEMSRQTAKARSRVVRRSSAVAFSG